MPGKIDRRGGNYGGKISSAILLDVIALWLGQWSLFDSRYAYFASLKDPAAK